MEVGKFISVSGSGLRGGAEVHVVYRHGLLRMMCGMLSWTHHKLLYLLQNAACWGMMGAT